MTAASPDWHRETNRVDLEFRVAAGPRFRVEFEGRGALRESVLRSHLTFPASGVTDQFEQQASARELEAAYRERGYHFAKVEPGEASDGDIRILRFVITEGPRVTVESLAFTGNQSVSGERLAKEVETRRPALFRRGLFRQDVLDHDVGVVLAYLRSEGYAEATVGPAEVHFSDDRSRARVVIPINEGPRLTVGAVAIEGAHVFTPREIAAALPFKVGAPWQTAQADNGRRAIERLYAGRGYHGAEVRTDTSRQGTAVDIRYDIDEGTQTRIGRVLLRGLLIARESVVRRTLPFQSGDVLTPGKLLEGQHRLGEFPAFDAVSVDPLRPPPGPYADVEVTLRERKPWHLDFGLGYSNADGARGFLEIGHDDVFGIGASLSLRQRLSAGGESTGKAERTDILGRLPFVLGTPWWVDMDIFQEWSEQLGYDLAQAGIWISVHRTLFPEQIKGLRGDLRYRFESARYSNVDPLAGDLGCRAGPAVHQQRDTDADPRPARGAPRPDGGQPAPDLARDRDTVPRQRRRVPQGLDGDAVVLQLAASDGRRHERATRARHAVRKHAGAGDPGPVLCRRRDDRPRLPRGPARAARCPRATRRAETRRPS